MHLCTGHACSSQERKLHRDLQLERKTIEERSSLLLLQERTAFAGPCWVPALLPHALVGGQGWPHHSKHCKLLEAPCKKQQQRGGLSGFSQGQQWGDWKVRRSPSSHMGECAEDWLRERSRLGAMFSHAASHVETSLQRLAEKCEKKKK